MKKYILLIAFLYGISCSAQCLAPAEAYSKFSANRENVDGVFKFDYKIEALLTVEAAGFTVDHSRNGNKFKMEYYVNSADGSILFPGGLQGFFKQNFIFSDAKGTVDAAIWKPNGQMVIYVHDAQSNQPRAITRETLQTAAGRYQNDFSQIERFMDESLAWGEWREPLPGYVRWDGDVKGYKADLKEPRTGMENTWIIYFDEAPTPIKTTMPMMGFMVGVLKDTKELQCNRLAVYTKVIIGGRTGTDYMEMELRSIKPMGITFDATAYKPARLSGTPGTDIQGILARFEVRMLELELQREELKRLRSRCGTSTCRNSIDRQIEENSIARDRLNCQIAKAMGMEDKLGDCGS